MTKSNRRVKLTPKQQEVARCKEPIISLRGFYGTGKTDTLCAYIDERLQQDRGVRILAVSLTKRAANNLLQRLTEHPGWSPSFRNRVTVGTFHSLAYKYLRRFAGLVGFASNFDIDNGINERLLEAMLEGKKYSVLQKPLKRLMKTIRKHVRSGKGLTETAQRIAFNDEDADLIKKAVRTLQRKKQQLDVMDFDDLLYHFYRLLRKEPHVVDAVLKDHTHLVVDEFQDTTGIQWRISKLLIGKGICFVGAGDPYQTIHRYAGASLKRFAQLEAIRGCKTFELTENHRSTKQVVDLANGLLSQNCEGLSNKVKAKKTGPKPRVYLSKYRPLLYQAIIKLIRRHMKQGMKLSDIAVVARFDSDLKQFMPTLDKCKVPYVIFSKQAKEEPIALKAYRSVLKIALNDGDKSSWATILPFLSGVGKKAATDILKILKQNRYHHSALTGYLTTHRKGDLEALFNLIEPQQCGDRPLRVGLKALEFMRGLRKRIRDLDSYSATITEMASGTPTIGDLFLSCNEISFGAHHNGNRNYKSKGELTLGNIHQIKGREFRVIFVLGSPDRLFENHKTFNNKLKIADELFVMLTAVTRTKKHLYLLFQMTHDEWQKKQHKLNPSIFIRNCRRKSYRTYSVAESPPKKKLIMRGRNGG